MLCDDLNEKRVSEDGGTDMVSGSDDEDSQNHLTITHESNPIQPEVLNETGKHVDPENTSDGELASVEQELHLEAPEPVPELRRSSHRHTSSPLECNVVPFGMEGSQISGRTNFVTTYEQTPPHILLAQARLAAQDLGEPRDITEALNLPDNEKWKQAIQLEYDSIMENPTWKLVPLPHGRKTISNCWLFRKKLNPDGTTARFKARLVVRGFTQKEGIDYFKTFLPVVRTSSVRTLLATAAHQGLIIHQMDVQTAFLRGILEEEVYMNQPEGYVDKERPMDVCKLLKTLYGLKQSAKGWNQRIHKYLLKRGFIQSESDSCVYIYRSGNEITYLALYVDDTLLLSSSKKAMDEVKQILAAEFRMTDLGAVSFFLGIQVVQPQHLGFILIHQDHYIQQMLEKFGMKDAKTVATPAATGVTLSKDQSPSTAEDLELMQNIPYRMLVGCLLWVANWTRPDISFAVSTVSQFLANPGQAHWVAAKRVLRYLKGTSSLGIKYDSRSHVSDRISLQAWSDSDWAADKDTRKSMSAYCIQESGGMITWSSKKQSVVALSSTEAEYAATVSAAQEIMYLRALLKPLGHEQMEPILLHCDNQSAILLAKNPVMHSRTRHVDVKLHFIRKIVEDGHVALTYVAIVENVVDMLTKALPREKHNDHTRRLGL